MANKDVYKMYKASYLWSGYIQTV